MPVPTLSKLAPPPNALIFAVVTMYSSRSERWKKPKVDAKNSLRCGVECLDVHNRIDETPTKHEA